MLAHSLLAHKEFRFIMQMVPLASVLTGKGYTDWHGMTLIFPTGYALHQMFSLKKCRGLFSGCWYKRTLQSLSHQWWGGVVVS